MDRWERDYKSFRVTADYLPGTWPIQAAQVCYHDCRPHARTMTTSVGFLLPIRG